MKKFIINSNTFLSEDINAFYHTDYFGYRSPGNPDYINELKNTYSNYPKDKLDLATSKLMHALLEDLPQTLQALQLNSLFVCVVPRAKVIYQPNQLLFKATIRKAIRQLNGFVDGTGSIERQSNTKTTHLPPNTPNYNNDGDMPYKGITFNTCNISSNVTDKDVLLIDDIYTRNINIDEDAIQALLDCGARSVAFYAIGKTIKK